MPWKPKEKDLSPEEAVALAKKELAPFWFGSEPKIVGLMQGSQHVVLPLDPEFVKKNWLFFFIDLTDFFGEFCLNYAKEWHTRYSVHEVLLITVVVPTYQYLKNSKIVQEILEKLKVEFALVVDAEELITQAFQAQVPPKVILLSEGRRFFEFVGNDSLEHSELRIQQFLRSRDSGLPLLPIFRPKHRTKDITRIEFGLKPKTGIPFVFPLPGFMLKEGTSEKIRAANFQGAPPKKLEPGGFFLQGVWMQDDEKIATSDPTAMMTFNSPGSKVSIIVQNLSKNLAEVPMIAIEVNGDPAFEAIAGEHMVMDDMGRSVVKVQSAQLLHILADLPEKKREITLRFFNADSAHLCIYGIRFGDSLTSNA